MEVTDKQLLTVRTKSEQKRQLKEASILSSYVKRDRVKMDKEAFSEMDDDDSIDDSTGDVDADTRTFVSTHLIFSHLLDFDKKKNTLSELNAQNKDKMMIKGVLNYSKY